MQRDRHRDSPYHHRCSAFGGAVVLVVGTSEDRSVTLQKLRFMDWDHILAVVVGTLPVGDLRIAAGCQHILRR